ncbi:hypothetical protein [Francisella hispaniensis]|uniref:Uncharacterized protein n=1 Tax=Francisella hispaniensis FSC454 TaxID=1088883 RepID=A0AAC9J7D9_9GAMM|nr:hypothetical protein [Francisella hispaniensis]APD50190.1 hypothetical protein FSC454_03065 [Francisella hispaniensis FSC454]KYW83389.1 hypothetical protein AUF42_05920 [Francisella hispaniensis FSC454]
MEGLREIAWSNGYTLPDNVENQTMAKYRWFDKSKYIVRVDWNSFVFGDKRTGERYKVVNGELVEKEQGIKI